jgi:drug/metabolite transporter (DMT)-like permease
VRSRAAAIDVAIMVAVAAVVLIVSPGVALTAVIAVLVVLLCALSFGVEALVVRARGRGRDH